MTDPICDTGEPYSSGTLQPGYDMATLAQRSRRSTIAKLRVQAKMIEGTIAKEKEDLEVHIEAARNLDAEVIEALLEGEQPKRELRGKNLSKAGHMVGAYVEGADVERRQDIQKLRSVQHDMLEEIAALEREEKEEERANMPCASFAGVDLLNLDLL